MPTDVDEKLITEIYCKIEYRCVLSFHILVIAMIIVSNIFVFTFSNPFRLLFKFYIIFLPPHGFSYAWELNYILMTLWLAFCVIFYICYFPMPMVLMNQSCWLLDMTLIAAKQMNTTLVFYEDPERQQKIDDHLKKLEERLQKFAGWQNEAQKLLQWNFNVEFQIITFILCFSIYTLSSDLFASYVVLNLLCVCASQLFVLCWMGTRVTNRFNQLSFDLSKNWYLMEPRQRKMLQMILHLTQNLKTFKGIFRKVSLETYRSVFFSFRFWIIFLFKSDFLGSRVRLHILCLLEIYECKIIFIFTATWVSLIFFFYIFFRKHRANKTKILCRFQYETSLWIKIFSKVCVFFIFFLPNKSCMVNRFHGKSSTFNLFLSTPKQGIFFLTINGYKYSLITFFCMRILSSILEVFFTGFSFLVRNSSGQDEWSEVS